MPTQAAALNQDSNGKLTSGYYGDRGDGTSNWFNVLRVFDGGHVTFGLKADAAVTDPSGTATHIALMKGLLTQLRVGGSALLKAEDAAAASGDTGIMALAVQRGTATADGANGDYTPLHVDSNTRLRVIERNSEVALTNFTTATLIQGTAIKASAGTLYGVQGYCDAAGYILLANKASAPAAGEAPVIPIPTVGTVAPYPFSLDLGPRGRAFSTGIAVAFSSSGTAYTAGGTHLWIDAQYE